MTPPISFTFDLEDHRPAPTWKARYPEHTRRLLDFLDERAIRATVFVVGRVAERSPDVVREVADRGHEVGLHNFEHWALFSCVPSAFREKTARCKAMLEDLTGREVAGFRAPAGTLMPTTYWATEVLAELGFRYSASVLPVQTYGVGFPGCPAEPFRWPSGLLEAPCPCVGVGPVGLPIMGGTFLRVLPLPLVRLGMRRLPAGSAPWVYAHPYDIDSLERFWVVPEVHLWGSLLLWINRGLMLRKLDRLVTGRTADPLGERLAALDRAGRIPDWAPERVLGADPGPVAKLLRRERTVRGLTPPDRVLERELTGAARAADG
ncbi:MAG: polysaccharide deacetylase family protein [Actinobacteria bacterium]|nr:polysaccharide deacetylase family protein [Actinomycetota bacterium]